MLKAELTEALCRFVLPERRNENYQFLQVGIEPITIVFILKRCHTVLRRKDLLFFIFVYNYCQRPVVA